MMSVEKSIKESIKLALKEKFDIDEEGLVMLEIPNVSKLGDYSTNVAMRLTKRLGKNPREIANEIISFVESNPNVDRVEIAGPGFINFFVNPLMMANVINTVIEQGDNYGRNIQENPENIMVEYVSANPTGRLHVGHARGAAWGDSLTRILDFAGYNVSREYYVNDLGAQVDNLAVSIYSRYLEFYGNEMAIPEDGYMGEDVIAVAKRIQDEVQDKYVDVEESVWFPFFKETGIKYQLEQIEKDLDNFGVHFDTWSSEKEIKETGAIEAVIENLKELGTTYEQEGALWFRSTDFGDDKDRVLIKSNGAYTYFVPDIAYHINKANRTNGKLIDLLGGDHHGYIARMKAALEALGYKDVLDIDIIQMVRIVENGQEVKMSKRTGNAIGLIELVDEIGIDATRYFFASRALNSQLDFDLTVAKMQSNENPVYYAQYAHARICTILNNNEDIMSDIETYQHLNHPKEIELMKTINEFKNVVKDSAKQRLVNKITNYIQDLAGQFHSYYGEVKIVDKDNLEITNERLQLLKAVRITLSNALNLIGVNAPESM